MPGLLVMGLGMGLIVAPLFGIIIAAVGDDEVGSASGVLNAVQQLASAIGVALLGTVFFDALGAGDFHHALGRTLWLDLGLTVLAIVADAADADARPARGGRAVRRARVAYA